MSDIDTMGIFTEAQRNFDEIDLKPLPNVDELREQEATARLAVIRGSAAWTELEHIFDEQIAQWNSISALGDVKLLNPVDVQANVIARQLACNFLITLKTLSEAAANEMKEELDGKQ